MARYFPPLEVARMARERYQDGTLAEALTIARSAPLDTPRENDVPDLLDEFAGLLESLGIPDRDGTDFAVIVPVVWAGRSIRATVTLDFGRRLLTVVNHPVFGTVPIPKDVLLHDLQLPQNLRHELLTVLVTYKNPSAHKRQPDA